MIPTFVLCPERKNFHTRKVIDSLPNYEVIRHCGMPTVAVKQLVPLFNNLESSRAFAIPLETKVLTFLSYLRSGSFQWSIGSLAGISQSSASRIIESSTNEIVSRLSEFIHFPRTAEEINTTKTNFYKIKKFPNVIGVIDGTHIGIKSPSVNERAYVNRKQIHSINVQVISDSEYRFMDVVAKWPGSAHDSFIWRNSAVRERITTGEFGSGWLLGKLICLNSEN